MKMISKEISNFLTDHHILSVTTCDSEGPYSFNCYYTFHESSAGFIFKSHEDTSHANMLEFHPRVSGTIHTDVRDVHLIQGVQIRGMVRKLSETNKFDDFYINLYNNMFSEANLFSGVHFLLKAEWIKFTDNTKHIGHKILWEFEP